MKLVEIISNTLFCRAQDGRIIFTPWGKYGPCYLLTEAQRINRAKIQLAYYIGLFVGMICLGDTGKALSIILVGFLLGNYALYWLFSRTLPTTERPGKPDFAYTRERLRENSRNFGKPTLWILLLISAAMAVAGVLAGVLLGDLLAVLSGGFFAFPAYVFARRLKHF